MNRFQRHTVCGALFIAIGTCVAIPNVLAQDAAGRKSFNVPAQPAAAALNAFAEQADITLVFSQDRVQGIATHPLQGNYTTVEGLQAMLAGTDLHIQKINGTTISIGDGSRADGVGSTPPRVMAGRARPAPAGKAVAHSIGTSNRVPGYSAQRARDLGTVIVTGTRTGDRTASSALTPIDVIPQELLLKTSATNLSTAIERFIPSLNMPLATDSDLMAFQRPFQLRGMAASQVLVLVDGKRWHPGAIVFTSGDIGQGSQTVDLNTIPVAAIDHIEVLRDGASAQYGSDAVAGVINIILKKGGTGGTVALDGGKYSAGDGMGWQLSGDFGAPLGNDQGWLRISAQNGKQNATNRAGVDDRPGFSHLGQTFRLGVVPFTDRNVMLNMQYAITPGVQVYAFGHFGQRIGEPSGYFRYGSNTPEPSNPLMVEMYPDGFLPIEHGNSLDRSLTAGLRGTVAGWHWDLGGSSGQNRLSYATTNTANYALINDFGSSPGRFHDGTLKSSQQTINIDISRPVAVGWLHDPLTVSFGTQWIRDAYNVRAGDLGSYYVGTSGVSGGAQGFAGWGPQDEVNVSRTNLAEYVQLETNLTEKLGVSLAARHEDYSDFGTANSAALSGRFDFTDSFALRGTVSTGFRAPTLGQQFYSETASGFFGEGNSLGLPPGPYLRGLVPTNNPVAVLLGAKPLKAEKSRNYTFGGVWSPTNELTMSLDLYQITVDDTISQSTTIATSTPGVRAYLTANGIGDLNYRGVSYFTNAGTVRTRGADLVSSYRHLFVNGGTALTTLSMGYHANKVTNVMPNPAVLDALGLSFQRLSRVKLLGLLADSAPRSKIILAETYGLGSWELDGVLTRYGKVTQFQSDPGMDQVYPGKWLLDLAASYKVNRWTFTLGGNNVLNTYPDKQNTAFGQNENGILRYWQDSPFGFEGSYVYGKVRYSW